MKTNEKSRMERSCRLVTAFALAMVFAVSIHGQTAPDTGYEVDGKIQLRLHNSNGDVWKDFRGEFKVFVNGPGWMIQTIETNDFGSALRREIGTTNGTEMFELVLPYAPLDQTVAPANLWGPDHGDEIAKAGSAYADCIPVGGLDSSFVGHLWLMFASGNYFRTAAPGQLTPVFDYWASPMLNSSKTVKAEWELSPKQGGLPVRVRYFEQGGEPTAVYTVTASTNISSVTIPTQVHFEQPLSHYKDVDIEVTAVRAGCSLTNLLPVMQGRLSVQDFRMDSNHGYVTGHWTTLPEARAIYAKLYPPKAPEPPRPEVKLPQRDLAKLASPTNLPLIPFPNPLPNRPYVPFRDAVIDRPPPGGSSEPERWLIKADDLKWDMVFCMNLAEHDRLARERRQTSYTLLWNRLTVETQVALEKKDAEMNAPHDHPYQPGPELDALVDNLNALIKGDSSYDAAAIPEGQPSGDTVKLLAAKPTGAALIRLNRLLLEDAFPMDIVRTPKLIADPASKLSALIVFRKIGFSTLADVTLLGEDGGPLWKATVNPEEIMPNSSGMARIFEMEGILDVRFGENDLIVRFNGKFSVSLDLKTGTMHQLPNT
jgi:hypothetical protein